MLAESVLRELGASKRTFHGVRGAVIWYRDQLARRLRTGGLKEFGSAPRSEERRQQCDATYASIAYCLRGVQHVAWLVAWYETTSGDGTWLAEKAELTRWAFTRRCKRTERQLRERMEEAGLLEEAC